MSKNNPFIITLIGSARFEQDFIDANRELTLRGFLVIGLSVLPSQSPTGEKNWYTDEQKTTLDLMHLEKIRLANAVVLLGDGYKGESTNREIEYCTIIGVPIISQQMVQEHWERLTAKKFPKGEKRPEVWDLYGDAFARAGRYRSFLFR